MDFRLSLVVLAGRDKCNLTRLFDSIHNLTAFPHEILIVYDVKNHGIPDNLPSMDGCTLLGIPFEGTGKQPEMRNVAIRRSSGDFIWFIDDDVTLAENAVEMLLAVLTDIAQLPEVGAIAGRIVEHTDIDPKSLKMPVYLSPLRGAVGYFNYDAESFPREKYTCLIASSGASYPVVPFVQGTNMVFRKSYLHLIGGFDEDLGQGYASFEDSEPCFALDKIGAVTVFCGDVSLVHHKMSRVGGTTRGHSDFDYATHLIRNYIIALAKNQYPSKLRFVSYLLCFTLGHILRIIRHVNRLQPAGQINSVQSVINSINAILKGVCYGISALARSQCKRINTIGF